ncbi:hypothetical protein GCM10010172_79420 [Paractinoplanes ferrugineus]|uniref:Lipoprotein n=1 Tax=Paractinoplanes ferrugineus TaxID=113564 RepID=A0A919J1G6_9ACTN|nr:hypothetical protein [Actinoplanes ferrugineus]GIE13016.1 hypothetical protein Afe05nite_48560 [Actinoplanes ferrugineus]
MSAPGRRPVWPAVLVLLVVTACTSSRRTPAPAPAPAGPTPAATGSPRNVDCVLGEAHLTTDFAPGPDDLTVGSVSWPGLRTWAAKKPADLAGDDALDFKIGVAVRAGATVTVEVADDDGGAVGLNYGQGSGYSPTRAVTFHGCPDTDTAYIGGFHVAGPRCVPLVITEPGRPAERVRVSFFAGPC